MRSWAWSRVSDRLAGLDDGGARPIREDHAVHVVGIHHPGGQFHTDDQQPPGRPRADETVALDEGQQPARATKRQVVGHGVGVLDPQALLDP